MSNPVASCSSFCPTLPPLSDSLKGPGWDAAGEKHHLGHAKLSLADTRASQSHQTLCGPESLWTCLPLARSSPLQLVLGQQQRYITSAKPQQPQDQELLLGNRGKGTTCLSKECPAAMGLLLLKAAEFSCGNGGFIPWQPFWKGGMQAWQQPGSPGCAPLLLRDLDRASETFQAKQQAGVLHYKALCPGSQAAPG